MKKFKTFVEETILEYNYVEASKVPRNVMSVVEKIRAAARKGGARRARISVSQGAGKKWTIEVEVNDRNLMDDDAFLDSISQDIIPYNHKTIDIDLMMSQHPAPKYTV